MLLAISDLNMEVEHNAMFFWHTQISYALYTLQFINKLDI